MRVINARVAVQKIAPHSQLCILITSHRSSQPPMGRTAQTTFHLLIMEESVSPFVRRLMVYHRWCWSVFLFIITSVEQSQAVE